jgi:hypothetical protein
MHQAARVVDERALEYHLLSLDSEMVTQPYWQCRPFINDHQRDFTGAESIEDIISEEITESNKISWFWRRTRTVALGVILGITLYITCLFISSMLPYQESGAAKLHPALLERMFGG